MKKLYLIPVFLFSFTLNGCGGDDPSDSLTVEDTYQSCSHTVAEDNIDFSLCFDFKNAEDTRPSCEDLDGTYAAGRCSVEDGVQGCVYRNSQDVEITRWFTGASWTPDADEDTGTEFDCADDDGQIVTAPL